MDWVRDLTTTPAMPRLYNGPIGGATEFSVYPTMHHLTNNRTFMSGSHPISAWVDHDPTLPPGPAPQNQQVWSTQPTTGFARSGSAAVIVPNVGNFPTLRDEVMIIGGSDWSQSVLSTSIRILAGGALPITWGSPQNFATLQPRMLGNAVLVPNGDIVLIGGCSDHYWTTAPANHLPVTRTDVWDRAGGWRPDASQQVKRMYHSTAVLLPSGKIASAGSDIRTVGAGTVPFDWEIYVPRNIANGQPIPQFAGSWAGPGYMSLTWGTKYYVDFTLSSDSAISRLVLMRPCSTTHANDMEQRYVELATYLVDGTSTVEVKTPAAPNWSGTVQGDVVTPPGWYMAFLVAVDGASSVAKWVELR